MKAIPSPFVEFSRSFPLGTREKGKDPIDIVGELAFIQRCIDKGYGNRAVWQWRKASLLCRTSVVSPVPDDLLRMEKILEKRSMSLDISEFVYDRSQYENAFETLKAAIAAEPRLDKIDGRFRLRMILGWDSKFPVLCREPRFKRLMSKFRNNRKKAATDRPSTK